MLSPGNDEPHLLLLSFPYLPLPVLPNLDPQHLPPLPTNPNPHNPHNPRVRTLELEEEGLYLEEGVVSRVEGGLSGGEGSPVCLGEIWAGVGRCVNVGGGDYRGGVRVVSKSGGRLCICDLGVWSRGRIDIDVIGCDLPNIQILILQRTNEINNISIYMSARLHKALD